MDFLNHSRDLFRQALGEAIRNNIPKSARTPIVLGLLLMGSLYTVAPYLFRRGESRARSPEDYNLYKRCMGILMLIAAGILVEFGGDVP